MVSIYLKENKINSDAEHFTCIPEGSTREWREAETKHSTDVSLQRCGQNAVLVTGHSLVGESG